MREGRLQSWFARLSDRERNIVLVGGVLVFAVVLVLTGLLVSRKVAAMEEAVAANDEALGEIRQLAPEYLRARREEKAIEEALDRARGQSLQSLLLAVAKDIQFERKFSEDGGGVARLSDFIKFSNANEVLADLTTRKKRRASSSKKKKKSGKQVFVASIEVVFDRIPDTALFQFLERVDTHEGGLFATSLDISRDSPNREQFRAKMTIAQFRYGAAEEGS